MTGPHRDYFSRPLAPSAQSLNSQSSSNARRSSPPRAVGAGRDPPFHPAAHQQPRMLAGRIPPSAHPGTIPHFPSHDASQFQAQRPHPPSFSPRLEGPVPQSAYTYRGPLTTGANPRHHGFFSPPLPRAEGLPQPINSRPSPSSSFSRDDSFSRWGPTENSGRHAKTNSLTESPRRHDVPSTAGPSGSSRPPQAQYPPPFHPSRPDARGEDGLPNRHVLPPIHRRRSTHKSTLTRSSEDEEEEDELVDEDDVGGAHHDPDVLSRPLQLLAYASTAAARKQAHGGFRDPRSVAAAATLGLISASAPPKRTESQSQSLPLPVSVDATSAQKMASVGVQGGGGAEASTLENGNWEYRAGRVRAIRGAESVDELVSSPVKAAPPTSGGEGLVDLETNMASTGSSLTSQCLHDSHDSLTDEGPHLGKRRRSDDEPLPLPRSRKGSMLALAAGSSKRSNIAESRGSISSLTNNSKLVSVPRKDANTDADPNEQPSALTSTDNAEEQADAIGASRKGYFRFSLYSSKLDVDTKDDPIEAGVASLKDMEDLFDLFFNKINPSNFIFDPFLHSLSYIRARSKFLLTVIASISARMSSEPGSAELTEKLERHWKNKLFPEIVIGGYKSVEISQAFLLVSLFHRPTHIIVEDRAWQYLGMAIRIATEVGVNIALAPNTSTRDNELLSRRVRNRQRLWKSLLIAEGTLSTQFGRPCTLSCTDSPLAQLVSWNREDFALPEDAALVCQIELRKLVERHTKALEQGLHIKPHAELSEQSQEQDDKLTRLGPLRTAAYQDLEVWKRTWCPTGGLDQAGIGCSMAMGAFLVRWSPYSRLIYNYWRCHLNSVMLQAAALADDVATPIAYDSMQCVRELIGTLLNNEEIGEQGLPLAPNAVVVMATYAAVSALRLTKLDLSKHAFIDSRSVFEQVLRLADALEIAGRTPEHRDGAAAPYGTYLRSVLALFDTDSKSSSSVASHALGDDVRAPLADSAGKTAAAHSARGEGNGTGPANPLISPATAKSMTAALADATATSALLQPSASSIQDSAALTPALNALGMGVAMSAGGLPSGSGGDSVAPVDSAASAAAAADEVATLSKMYTSDPEVWEFLGSGAGAGTDVSSSAAAALWPATSTTAYLG